jgi:zinc protease
VLVKPTTYKADEVLVAGVSPGGLGDLAPLDYFSAQIGPALLERGGAGELDAVELRKMMTGKYASISATIDQRSEGMVGSASPSDLEVLFELLWAKVRTPRVDTAAITAYKSQLISIFQNRSNQPRTVYFDTISVTMTQGHPLARPITTGLIDSLDVHVGLRVFTDRFSDFSDFTFVFVGAVQPDALRPLVEQWLASLPGAGRTESPRTIVIDPPSGAVRKVVYKGVEPQAQTHVVLTGRHPWSRADAMRSTAITEVVQMRLRDVLREDLGGTYGPGFSTGIDRTSGQFQTAVNFGADPARVDSLAGVALEVVRKFAAEGPTDDELAKVRENLLRTRERAMTENGFWLGLLQGSVLWNDDPAENVESYAARVAALDAAGVRALAQVLLSEANIARFTLLPERQGANLP